MSTEAAESTAGRRFAIAAIVIVGVIIALNVVAQGLDRAVGGNEPSGVAGSSYGTQDTGLAAAAALFPRYDHPVARQRGSLADATLDPSATLFVIEPQTLTEDDEATLLEFVSRGGRLVIGGSDPFYLNRLRDRPPQWQPDGIESYVEIEPSLHARRVAAAGNGSWAHPGSGTVLAHTADVTLLTEEEVVGGRILFLADPSPIQNAYLGRADNAAFALGLAGDSPNPLEPPRPIVFAEGVHGYGATRGPERDPDRVEGLVGRPRSGGSRGRMVTGPAVRPTRSGVAGVAARARAEYVRALAVSLERTRDPGTALAPMQQWARLHIARRAHLRSDASPEEIDRAAIALGFSETERAALWYPPTDDNTALALGQLVSRLSQDERSRA